MRKKEEKKKGIEAKAPTKDKEKAKWKLIRKRERVTAAAGIPSGGRGMRRRRHVRGWRSHVRPPEGSATACSPPAGGATCSRPGCWCLSFYIGRLARPAALCRFRLHRSVSPKFGFFIEMSARGLRQGAPFMAHPFLSIALAPSSFFFSFRFFKFYFFLFSPFLSVFFFFLFSS